MSKNYWIKTALVAAVLVFTSLFTGCSIKMLTIDATGMFMEDVVKAFFEEDDLKFAEESAPANLKLLDGLIRGSNYGNDGLLLKGCKLYGMYAMGFLEDSSADKDKNEENLRRASGFYLKAKKYGMKILTKNNDFKNVVEGSPLDFKKMMIAFGENDAEALFWTAFAWGEYINLNRHNVAAIADMPKVKAMIDRVKELNPDYFYGMPHLFLIVYYSLPRMFGGDPEKAKASYDRVMEISDEKFILAHFFMAKYYAVQQQDREFFNELLGKIKGAEDDTIKETLFTKIAKKKAKILKKREKQLF